VNFRKVDISESLARVIGGCHAKWMDWVFTVTALDQ
jgi:hypothetical protein